MTLYSRALRHAWRMVGLLVLCLLLIATLDRLFGHSNLAFATAIVLLFLVNRPILGFNCPSCGKNAFFRGRLAVFWPNRICTCCGHDLDGHDPDAPPFPKSLMDEGAVHD
jgi:hypothetical protein